jgi:transposase InsO family protein
MASDLVSSSSNKLMKLKGRENYPAWAQQVQYHLREVRAWDIVQGQELAPVLVDQVDGKDVAMAHKDELGNVTKCYSNMDKHEEKYADWDARGSRAARVIMTAVTPEICQELVGIDGAQAMWSHLKKYEGSGPAQRMEAYSHWRSLQFDGKDIEAFTSQYTHALRRLEAFRMTMDAELKVYEFIDRIAPFYMEWANITRASLRLIPVDNGKLTESKLPTLDSLIADLLDHDKELKRTEKVNLTLGRRGVGHTSYGSSQQPSNGKHCSHCKRDGHIEKDCWQKHPEKRPKPGHKKKHNKQDDNKSTSTQALTLAVHPTGRETSATSLMPSASNWCLDSGSFYHCTNDMNDFLDGKFTTVDSGVMVGDGRILKGHALGSVKLPVIGKDGRETQITFTNVLYVPLLGVKLISERLLRSKKVYYSSEEFALYNRDSHGNANYLVDLKELHGLPHLVLAESYKPKANASVMIASNLAKRTSQPSPIPSALLNSHLPPTSTGTAKLWHARLGHITDRALNKLNADGVTIQGDYTHGRCDACSQGKFKKKHSRVKAPRPGRIFDEISVDLVHSTYTALNKERWLTLITDGKSLFRHEFTHSKKSDAGKLIIDHLARIERQTGRKIKRIRIDNGTEFATLVAHCKTNGITLMPSTAHNSQQNGRAEVSNYLVERMARTMMIAGKVQQFLWPWAVQTAVQLLNTTPSSTIGMAPIEMLAELGDEWKTTINLGHFRAYGCRTLVYDESVQRGDKYSSRVLVGKLVGYERGATNIFYVYVPTKGKVIRTSNVEFDESRFDTNAYNVVEDPDEDNGYIEPTDELYSAPVSTSSGGDDRVVEEPPTVDNSDESEHVENVEQVEEFLDTGMPEPGAQTPPQPLHRSETPNESDPEDNIIRSRPPETSNRRSERERTKSTKASANDTQGLTSYGTKRAVIAHRIHKVYFTSIAYKGTDLPLAKDIVIPQSYAEAISSPQADNWKAAMLSEVSSLTGNDTWDLVNPLDHPNATIVAGRWVFTVKANSEGLPDRFKARWVARGFTQRYGIDYDDTYASVTKPATVKIMLALVARLDMECKQYDLVTAFLNALIKKHRIFVEMPHGFEEYEGKMQKICLLRRALYGLKQSPLLWYEELTTFLQLMDLKPSINDPCLFTHASGAYILVYVDDLLIMAKSLELINKLASLISAKYAMKELGDVAWFLGCRIIRDRKARKIWIVQDSYLSTMAERFGIELKKCLTPMKAGIELVKAPAGFNATKQAKKQYQELVGSLMWPATITRGDVAVTVSKLAMHLTNPTTDHLQAAIHCAEYLLATKNDGICLGGNELQLEGFVDASWADNSDDRRSTCGFVFKFGGGPVFWKSGRQSVIATSTTEAEYVAMSLAAREAAALRRLVSEVLQEKHPAIILHEDSQPAIYLLNKPPGADTRTKHMDVKYHFIRQEVDRGAIAVVKIPTDKQAADGLTKSLDRIKHEQFKQLFGIVDCSEAIAIMAH